MHAIISDLQYFNQLHLTNMTKGILQEDIIIDENANILTSTCLLYTCASSVINPKSIYIAN